ncbi:hypothetical protein C8R43DRAFT_242231 [Mycena crocata]|nr:hypothetical protein C8R43DRAFT_242231 [Mycena crocata]
MAPDSRMSRSISPPRPESLGPEIGSPSGRLAPPAAKEDRFPGIAIAAHRAALCRTGPCVYLSLSGNNVQYSVSIDGEVTNFVSPSAESQSDCTIGFSRTGMSSGSHDLQIKVSGVSDMRRRGLIEWAFDILQLLITTLASGLLGDASSNVASWPLVLFSALVCLSPYA